MRCNHLFGPIGNGPWISYPIALAEGGAIRTLNVVDAFTRRGLAIETLHAKLKHSLPMLRPMGAVHPPGTVLLADLTTPEGEAGVLQS